MNWYMGVLKNYVGFSGRARRKEYWMFTLFNLIILIVLSIVDRFTGTLNPSAGIGLLSGIYSLAVILPSIAVAVRRLHDTSRTGWWMLLVFVPFVGGLILLVFMLLDSTPGENQYGPNPKGA